MSKTALIVVDVQNDFCEGGSLAVEGGELLAEKIGKFLSTTQYDYYIASKDWHIDPGEHFDNWPVHCVASTEGAGFKAPLEDCDFDFIIHKGQYSDGYSAFDETSLHNILTGLDVGFLDIVGIAGDYCVKATAIDAVDLGYDVAVLKDLTVSVDEFPTEELFESGVDVEEGDMVNV